MLHEILYTLTIPVPTKAMTTNTSGSLLVSIAQIDANLPPLNVSSSREQVAVPYTEISSDASPAESLQELNQIKLSTIFSPYCR